MTLSLDPGNIDGPNCYIDPPSKGAAAVSVSIPNPAGGTLRVLNVSVSCMGQTKLATIGAGASQDFQFEGTIHPGAIVTATATASGGTGRTWTGSSAEKKWLPACRIVTANWTGNKSTSHQCEPDPSASGGSNGYEQTDEYSITGSYGVNPEPGAGKTGQLRPAKFGEQSAPDGPVTNGKTVYTPLNGESETTKWYIAPPGTINCTMDAQGTVSDITPKFLDNYPHDTTSTTEGTCTTTITGSETGPS